MKKIFITRQLPSIAKDILSKYFEIDENNKNEPFPENRLPEIVSEYNGVLSTLSEKFTKETLKKRGKLEVISNYAAGLDNIDVKFAKSIGISVYNTPDVVTNSTADLTFALLLSLIRKISPARDFVRQNKWKSWNPEIFLGEELNGKKFGIIGFGRIGRAVAKRALGFGLNVIFYDPFVSNIAPFIKSQTRQVEFDELLKESDYVSIHVPLTKKTENIINSDSIKKMSKKPIILNLARGEIIETNSLVNALKEGQIRGAALDVTYPEPISGSHPLCHIQNCIIVPHIGTATKECRYNMAKLAAQNIIKHFEVNNDRKTNIR